MVEPYLKPISFASERLGETQQRIYTMIREGILPPGVVVRLGRHVRINPEKLEEFISGGGAGLAGGWRREAQ